MIGYTFCNGDKVEKYTGDYRWEGIVVSCFQTPSPGNYERYVVAHPVGEGYVLHIYSAKNLRLIEDKKDNV